MKTLYLDCQSGISGDMTLAALIDLGADLSYIIEQLQTLPIDPFYMNIIKVDKRGISSKQLVLGFDTNPDYIHEHHHHDSDFEEHGHSHEDRSHHHHDHDLDSEEHSHSHAGHSHTHHYEQHSGEHVHTHQEHSHRKASTILDLITNSDLPERVKSRSSVVFQVIAEAEGKIHGMDPKDVHFHEVGAMDSIIDVIGVCLALENLNVGKIVASPVPTGSGKLKMAHGLYPIPAPATAELLKGIPLMNFEVEGELTTPTGAGFLNALVHEYGPIPPLTMETIGYGAGKKDFEHPNVLRAILFQEQEITNRETVIVLECQLDDVTGEQLGFVMEKLFESGALDVYYTPVIMKKNRPGTLITVLSKAENEKQLEELLLRETSTFGIRRAEWSRRALSRKFKKVESPYGDITVKIGYEGETIYQISPEYEEVKQAANLHHVSILEVYSYVQHAGRAIALR
ncbi:nickel pincer cofactor biosynthesis protein LarC [Peribacillus cavernae]|uniref:Pyridinium-3,5-bisthiocarboxylic acid mononucleotide nickel insertion protein n=1 Tax=Peribacillus cavernae TaxID=1674310 RepID=A0A433HFG1_9BACI|nr:nickel pincer cofactor biosynthesis protein LarC [Peribacillus cavernae]MDQ0219555.1 uncharacterized protein (TIGR00299 family) protein [Peribacillus cavernae]RUQ27038.1 nickel pincer cofactor biosynthesis protein LarC [Peribacillus cavernae]